MNRLVPDEVLLGLIQAQPAHGYELLELFRSQAHLGRIWTMSTSQLYAVLKRLEDSGAIQGQQVASPDAPSRIKYTITDRGFQQLTDWLYDPQPSTSIHKIRVMFLSRLYIANILGMDSDMIRHHQKKNCEHQRQELLGQRKKVASPVEALTLDFVITQLETAISWLTHCNINFSIHLEQ
jgi:DNA-binding PadR family transcriptional regulator